MTMPKLEKILAFLFKHAKLALSLIMIIDCVHKGKIIHIDISPSNILFYFCPNHVDRVYIGVCDWGLASRIVEGTPSVYGFPSRDEMERNKNERLWVALELFYVYSQLDFEISLEHLQKKRMYTKEVDAYFV
jgi:serine/threonine protein kinase